MTINNGDIVMFGFEFKGQPAGAKFVATHCGQFGDGQYFKILTLAEHEAEIKERTGLRINLTAGDAMVWSDSDFAVK